MRTYGHMRTYMLLPTSRVLYSPLWQAAMKVWRQACTLFTSMWLVVFRFYLFLLKKLSRTCSICGMQARISKSSMNGSQSEPWHQPKRQPSDTPPHCAKTWNQWNLVNSNLVKPFINMSILAHFKISFLRKVLINLINNTQTLHWKISDLVFVSR